VSKLSLGVEKAAARHELIARPDVAIGTVIDLRIPDSIPVLTGVLDSLGGAIAKGGWWTAAAVYAWTAPQQGRRTDLSEESERLTFKDFAALGIRGLDDKDTVSRYRGAWQIAIEREWAKPVGPGDDVVLPEQDFDLGLVRPVKPRADTPPAPEGTFATVVADPPWEVLTGPGWSSGGRARPLLYPTMSVDEIAALPVAKNSAPDAHLYLWTINAYIEDAYAIARAWGYAPSTLLTWCKKRHGIGLGGTYILTTEFVLFARRGSLAAEERIDSSWFEWPRRDHSVKPDEFFAMVERVSPGPRLEMFARRPREGWTVWGNEADDADPS
jgi:N6-adenosine-specific RNA methylase IME4